MRGVAGRGEKAGELWRRVMALLAVVVLAAGCVTTGASSLGTPEGVLPPGVDEEVLEAGAVAEATLALAEVWSVSSDVREVGARLSFTFWSERGALTLMAYSATGRTGPPAQPVDDEAFQEEVAKVLTRFAQRRTGTVELALERQEARWTVTYSTAAQPRPPEAKTLPVRRAGFSAEVVEAVSQGVGRVLRSVEVPAGGEAQGPYHRQAVQALVPPGQPTCAGAVLPGPGGGGGPEAAPADVPWLGVGRRLK
ncbi:MAG: hypothetical protein JXB05_17490 [Myxococcaceae bacterium]|nr:hypothetical protein [Myxococcaceae bacterium]